MVRPYMRAPCVGTPGQRHQGMRRLRRPNLGREGSIIRQPGQAARLKIILSDWNQALYRAMLTALLFAAALAYIITLSIGIPIIAFLVARIYWRALRVQ